MDKNPDDFDLTDRFKELTGDTLEDQWEENPDPPDGYANPSPKVVLGTVGDTAWLWSTKNTEEEIKFEGELDPVRE